ncbi:CRE_HP_G0146080.mRNA.1.CDS.1 [Saccharomyces cerevisiae]|nr:CRE_HP_G0017700.mRNA.1.CDS.1 [Saccharomyces cerevisiae]CAI5160473.1 CRE_HP_G0146080.mRNA.1.CDS.1 [Saccharomyces cerevisiae]CAI6437758.1 CRE_HP_G0017700.mRNA.1.CDS.1 [Saccharomyces cerevisiae]CAI6993902.1 CRE_HP_G0146080.mRNA.1.CDS.1 [Saccharomyces cerevisiae]
MPTTYVPINQPIGDGEDVIDTNRFTNIPETQNFDQFVTIDKIAEENRPLSVDSDREFLNSKYRHYREVIWDRAKTFITLSSTAIVIGCIAGFLQVFTETLVNWKTGHCQRNWLLNKSFCCNGVVNEVTSTSNLLLKRQEFECEAQGLWIAWKGHVSPFIIFMLLSVLFALISTLLVKYVAPMATGSGISEIKVWVSGFEYNKEFLGFLTLVIKSVALPLAISSGLSVGKEGPSVHYATCCGYLLTKWLLRDTLTYSTQYEYLTAASGAGVAVAFGAPIGGVLFGLEEIASANRFNSSTLWKSYYVALVAITTLKYIDPFRNGRVILFNVTYDRDWKVQEIPIFIALGIFGGLYGKYISKWNINFIHFRKMYLSSWPVQEVLFLATLTALISYFNEFLKLDMTESMGILFHECVKNDNTSTFSHRLCQLDENTHAFEFLKIFTSLCFATVIRALLVVVSYGARVPAGIFVPSMAVGATFGRAVSLLVERFISGPSVITPGAYAFLGAAATLSGITNLTLTVVVIMFELTGAFMYIIPLMIVVAITRIILSTSGISGGIADQMIMVNGFPYLEDEQDEEEEETLEKYTAEQLMSSKLITINETIYLSELESLLYDSASEYSVHGFPITKDEDKFEKEKRCIGYVLKRHLASKIMMQSVNSTKAQTTLVYFNKSNEELGHRENCIGFKDIMNESPITVKKAVPVTLLFRMFKELGCKTIIVEESGILKGLVTAKDILRFKRIKYREVHGAKFTYNEALDRRCWSVIHFIIKRFTINRNGNVI